MPASPTGTAPALPHVARRPEAPPSDPPGHERRPWLRRDSDEHRALAFHLRAALRDGNVGTARTILALLTEHWGSRVAHGALAEALAGRHDLPGTSAASCLWQERHMVLTARTVLESLRAELTPSRDEPLVLLATPEGDRHTLALLALSLELERRGRRTAVLDDLPAAEVGAVVAAARPSAVVISAHLRLTLRRARELTVAVRQADPSTVLAVGGPGVPPGIRGFDIVTDDPRELNRLLDAHGTVLTEREREVLLMVADGLTNSAIAERLFLSPATVKTHLDHILAKTGTEHRAAAVAKAFRHGWIR